MSFEEWLLALPNSWCIKFIFNTDNKSEVAILQRFNLFYEFRKYAEEYYDTSSKSLLRECLNQAIAEVREEYRMRQLNLATVNLYHRIGTRAQRILFEQLLALQKLQMESKD
jgi:hypothetical protein